MTEALITKHRPVGFETVIGQGAVIASLQKVLDGKKSQSFIFNGPAGTGKTTLARISAAYLDIDPRDITEVDAATYTGIDKTRELQQLIRYTPLGGGAGRAAIVDEAHRLSGQAWDSLLKAVEEPRAGVYWFFCTTNGAKIPKSIQSRCAAYTLKPVSEADLEKVIGRIIKREKIEVSEGVRQIICREANGSPRQAISNLVKCLDVKTAREASAILQSAMDSDATIELARFLLKPGSWAKAMAIMKKFDNESPEGVRIVIANYLTKVLAGANSDKEAIRLLGILEQFSTSYQTQDGMSPLILSVGRAMFAGE